MMQQTRYRNSVVHILCNALWTKMLSTTARKHSIPQSESQAWLHVLQAPHHLFRERGQVAGNYTKIPHIVIVAVLSNSATKDLNYRVEGKRPFTEPTKATPVEQRCQVFLEEFLDCNTWTAWTLLVILSGTCTCSTTILSPMILKKSGKISNMFFSPFQRAKRYSACSVQRKPTARLRFAQYSWASF